MTSFRRAVLDTPKLARSLRDGLQALSKAERKRIVCNDPRHIVGSINLDDALSYQYPNDPVWDYGVGVRSASSVDNVKWLEVHPASSQHVNDLLRKLRWLRQWLTTSAPALAALPGEFVWIASGKVSLQKGSPQMKRLAQEGLRFTGERFFLEA